MLAVIQLDQCHLAVAVNKGLLADTTHTLEVANVVGILVYKSSIRLTVSPPWSKFKRLRVQIHLGVD